MGNPESKDARKLSVVTWEPPASKTDLDKPDSSHLCLRVPVRYIIPPAELTIQQERILGEGNFRIVYQGTYRSKTVAVKTIKQLEGLRTLEEFENEVKIMSYLGPHPQIVEFVGVEISNVSNGSFYAIIEYSPFGSLYHYMLQNCGSPEAQAMKNQYDLPAEEKPDPVDLYECPIPLLTLISWSEQIAQGMEYLVGQGIVHGDVASRNILLFDGNVVKINDFSLSRLKSECKQIDLSDKRPLPWRWLAYETLKNRTFSATSDVWSFGVTLWEIFTLSQIPYPQYVHWDEEFIQDIGNGLRLRKPEMAPIQLYEAVMKPCWDLSPKRRPNFPQLLENIRVVKRLYTVVEVKEIAE